MDALNIQVREKSFDSPLNWILIPKPVGPSLRL
jgi:hypothetical protein